jgi:sucrose phosphorylase
MVQRTLEHGGFVSYKNMADGSRLPYELNINYLDALSNPAGNEAAELAGRKLLTAHAILLSLQGMPGIYFHSLFGSRGDRAAAIDSGILRRINRAKLECNRFETELDDDRSLRGYIWNGFQKMLHIRSQQTAFHPQATQRILATDRRIFAVYRIPPDKSQQILCLHNVSGKTVLISGLGCEEILSRSWIDLLTGHHYDTGTEPIEIAGFHSLWLQPVRTAD